MFPNFDDEIIQSTICGFFVISVKMVYEMCGWKFGKVVWECFRADSICLGLMFKAVKNFFQRRESQYIPDERSTGLYESHKMESNTSLCRYCHAIQIFMHHFTSCFYSFHQVDANRWKFFWILYHKAEKKGVD